MTVEKAYKILGIAQNSSQEKIKTAYKKLAKKYHPDFYQNNPLANLAEEKLKEVNEAYQLLLKNDNFSQKEELWKYNYLEDGRLFALTKSFKGYTGQDTEKSYIYTKIGNYKDGLKDGEWTTYSTQNGSKLYTEFFKNGVLDGERCTYLSYSNNDIILEIENYKNGLKDGEQKNFKISEEDENKTVLEYLSIWKYGKELKRIKYSNGRGRLEVCEKDNIKDFKENTVFFINDVKNGTGTLIYEDGTKEEIFLRRGCISFFSTKYSSNQRIEKDFYYLGAKRNKNILRCLDKIQFQDIINIPYIEDYKFYMTKKEYTFYRKINLIKGVNIGAQFLLQGKGNFEDKIEEWSNKIKEILISSINEIEFDQGNYEDYENNKDTFINYEEIREKYPEGFIPKFRRRSINIGIDNIVKKFYNELNTSRNLSRAFAEAQERMIVLFIDTFYRYSSKEYEFTYDNNLNGGRLVDDNYWINLFLDEKDTECIPDSLMLFLNLLLKDKLELSLINIYFGLRYKITQLVKEELEKIKENFRTKKWYSNYFAIDILKKSFKLQEINNIEDLILFLDYLLNNQENTISIELKNIHLLREFYNKHKNFITIIIQNNIFPLYEQELKNSQIRLEILNSKILALEKEANTIKNQEINLNIKECERVFSELNMEYLITNIDKDKKDIETIENITKFLSKVKNYELSEEQIRQLTCLIEIKEIVTSKQSQYQKEIPKLQKELKENNNAIQVDGLKILFLILSAIGGGYFGIKNLGFLFGVLIMIGVPVIISMLFSSIKNDIIKKNNDLKSNLRKVNEIIKKSTFIIERIAPFLSLFSSEIIEQKKINSEYEIKKEKKQGRFKDFCDTIFGIVCLIVILVVVIVGFKVSWWFLKLAYSKFIEAFSMI